VSLVGKVLERLRSKAVHGTEVNGWWH
jgi:hypothetical protein